MDMSYCKFNNTWISIGVCLEALRNGEKLSGEEVRACKGMFDEIVYFLINEGIEINEADFENWLNTIDLYTD